MRRRERELDAAPGPATPATQATEQVHEILREADRQANALRQEVADWSHARVRDIEAEALRYLDEARERSDALVAECLDPVVALSTIVEEHAERVISLLEEAEWIKVELRDLVREMRDGLPAQVEPSAERRVRPAPPRPPALTVEEPEPEPEPNLDEESIRLLSLQMAMQGSARSDVEHRICDEFGLKDPQAILDDVFGTGTPGSHRIAWNTTNGAI
ncbi:MAG TPA: hypothetical protein VMY78_01735 [Solirubrobacteraceae bacterium]|nr:hypothetical protein [Solirubrobacteraceae bacterium]